MEQPYQRQTRSSSLSKEVGRCRGVEQLHAPITAEGDEVQAALVLIPDWLDVHSRKL
jgi:hypothetical protein